MGPRKADAAVICRGVVKEFASGEDRVRVLHELDLSIALGEMTFLVGPSGCGKTTLLSAIAGMLSLDGGSISVFGTRIDRLGGTKLAQFRGSTIGFVFQAFNLLPSLTATENAAVPLIIQGIPEREAARRASAVLERLGLGPHLGKFPSQLSGGQQQRVAIARALVHEPRLIVCDEPTAALDAATGHSVMELLRDVALRPDSAMLIVTHDERILSFADRIAHMSDGRVVDITSRRFAEAAE